MTTTTINLTIPDDAWQETGWDGPENADRLLAQVCINGTMHHLEAYRAEVDDDGCIVLANHAMEEDRMPALQEVYDGAYELTAIRGAEYVVFMFPHAS
jgi:hypothetical protein